MYSDTDYEGTIVSIIRVTDVRVFKTGDASNVVYDENVRLFKKRGISGTIMGMEHVKRLNTEFVLATRYRRCSGLGTFFPF